MLRFSLAQLGLLFVLVGFSSLSYADTSQKLVTENYEIVLTSKCATDAAVCPKVNYLGVNKTTRKSIMLKGKYQEGHGYWFKNSNTLYRIGDDGVLSVQQGRKILLEEQGEWQ